MQTEQHISRRRHPAPLPPPASVGAFRSARGTLQGETVYERPATAVAGTTPDGVLREPFFRVLGRRLITVPIMFLMTAVSLLLLPVALPLAMVIDVAKRRPMVYSRFVVIINASLVLHIVGFVGLVAFWIAGGGLFGLRPKRWLEWNQWLERWWVGLVFEVTSFVYNMKYEVEGTEDVVDGPVILVSRHAALLDTLLPIYILSGGHGMLMRIVKKAELLNDPCVDSVGHRLPVAFVRRGSGQSEKEIAEVTRLLDGIRKHDAVVIFGEGTRFTAAKKAQVISKLEVKSPEQAAYASSLDHVLPLRPGGINALIDKRPDIDLAFFAHTGLEAANKLGDFINGSLINRTVKVKVWRVPAAAVPRRLDERAAWLNEEWRKVDRWIDENRDP